MTKTLVVMRHAKAKNPDEGQPDIERQLSEAGRRATGAALPRQLALWPAGKNEVQVWASPAERTRETAELLAKALKRIGSKPSHGVQVKDYLWSGERGALLDELRACAAPTVAVVGHNPYVEELIRALTGSHIAFSPGAMAAVDVEGYLRGDAPDDAIIPRARLLWFAQGPESQRWKTLVGMERTVRKAASAAQQKLDQFLESPDDPETLHKFRVSVRTLRSLLAFVRPWCDADRIARALDDLKQVVAATSRLRELDVLAGQAAAAPGASPDLARFCDEQAATERGEVAKALSGKQMRRKLDRACADCADLKWKGRLEAEGLDAGIVRTRFDEMAGALREDLSTLDFAQVERTHDVRKAAKRVRYCAEQFADVLGDDAVAVAKDMTAHQDDLGAICDARVNIDIINGLQPETLPEPVAWDLALLRAKNETFLYTTLRGSR